MSTTQPIVIKRVFKVDGHHGGSWKVAFADFATAMMAFFLLLWLLAATDEQEKAAISEFFNNPSAIMGASTTPPPAAAMGDGGPSNAVIDLGGSMALPRHNDAHTIAAEENRVAMESMRAELQGLLRADEDLGEYAEHLLISETPEGLNIQIIDQEKRSMFARGQGELDPFADRLLTRLARILNKTDNVISISGHTDAVPLNSPGYSNWELSADRANAARRALISGGLDPAKLGRVVGLGDTAPLVEDDPYHAVNRRISILVMNNDALQAMRAAARGLVAVE